VKAGRSKRVPIPDQGSRGPFNPGEHAIDWNGSNDEDERLAPGIYFARLVAGDGCSSTRVVIAP
jgi:hypothetical protein